jgi:multidrug resistance efflux pump
MTAKVPVAEHRDDSSPRPAGKLRRILPPFFLALAVGGGYGGYRFWLARQPYEWSGTVEARTIQVGSRTGGRVKKVLVREGDMLRANQAILELEVGDLEAQRLQAKAQLAQAEANLLKLKRGSRREEIVAAKARADLAKAAWDETREGARREQIEAAQARLRAAETSVEKAKLDRERAAVLFAKEAMPRADKDNADIAFQSAMAQRDAQQHQLDELKNGSRREELKQAEARAAEAHANARLVRLGSRVEDIRAGMAQVEAAKGRLAQIQVMIDELIVRTPRAARVEALDLRPGDILAPNATAATLLEEDQLYVRIFVPETQLGHIRVGQKVPVSVDSFPERTFPGVVERINQVGEYSPRNLQTADERANQVFGTRIGLTEGREMLRAGMAAFIQVPK